MRGRFVAVIVLVGAVGWPAAAAGQDRAGASNPREQEQCMPAPCVRGLAMGAAGALADPAPAFRAEGWRPLSIAKWGMLGSTAVAAVYGLSASLEADGLYDDIAAICGLDAGRCDVLPEGGYADPEVARLDRDARKLDERARTGLLATQIGVAATLALFILDLRDGGPPPNVPYVPPQIRVGIGRDGGVRVAGRIATP